MSCGLGTPQGNCQAAFERSLHNRPQPKKFSLNFTRGRSKLAYYTGEGSKSYRLIYARMGVAILMTGIQPNPSASEWFIADTLALLAMEDRQSLRMMSGMHGDVE